MIMMTNAQAGESSKGAHLIQRLAGMMIRPRRTVRSILDSSRSRHLGSIMVLAIVSALVHDSDLQGLDAFQPLQNAAVFGIVLIATLVGIGFISLIVYFVLPWSAWAAGHYFGGTGSVADLRVAVIWSLAPFVWALLFRIPALVLSLVGGDAGPPRFIFQEDGLELSAGTMGSLGITLFAMFALLELIIFVWYLVVASRAIGEAHGFSSFGGFGILLLAMILPLLTIAILAFAGWLYSQKISG